MSIQINLGAWRSVFAVPSQIVDEGLKFADGVKLKVLLYVLRNADRELALEEISKATGVNVTANAPFASVSASPAATSSSARARRKKQRRQH